VRAAPREDGRFAFGKPNNANQPIKARDERQFSIEFPHDKHQNVIASTNSTDQKHQLAFIVRASFSASQDKKPDYHNCSICHVTNTTIIDVPPSRSPDAFEPPVGTFKSMPHGHDLCFNCHWKDQKPASDDCGGCHKSSPAFVPGLWPKRISAKFNHEGGQGEHVQECTTCHINITRRSTLVGMTPDVPITICATCHKDNKKTTYPKIKTIEEEFQQYQKTGSCIYCHTADVSKKKPPASHEAAVR
jgi:hypothetical protein